MNGFTNYKVRPEQSYSTMSTVETSLLKSIASVVHSDAKPEEMINTIKSSMEPLAVGGEEPDWMKIMHDGIV